MGGVNPVSNDLQNAQISMLKKALELQAQPLQLVNGMQQPAQAAQPAQAQPADQKPTGLGNNIDVFG